MSVIARTGHPWSVSAVFFFVFDSEEDSIGIIVAKKIVFRTEVAKDRPSRKTNARVHIVRAIVKQLFGIGTP
jgi:transcription initiation factor IIE alpha subunit